MTTRVALYFAAGAAATAIAAAALTAHSAVNVLEARVETQVAAALTDEDTWLTLAPSGTVLKLSGTAPSRAAQIAALARIGTVAGGIRIVDTTTVSSELPVAARQQQQPAELNLELMRNGAQVTMFGTVPEAALADGQFADIGDAIDAAEVSDMLAGVPGRVDASWAPSVTLGRQALELVERGRVTVTPGSVGFIASAADEMERAEVLATLDRATPDGVTLNADISIPRPIVSPYVFRADLDPEEGLQLHSCTAESTESAQEMLADRADADACVIGLGAPSPEWDTAVSVALTTLAELGAGTVDMADADIAVVGPQGHDAEDFARAMDRMASALPSIFSLSASLPPPPEVHDLDTPVRPPRFTAVRTEDGAVRIRGDVPDARLSQTAGTFAEAQFGFNTVVNETAPRDDLPNGWAVRVVSGLQALGGLTNGQLEVTEAAVTLTGATPTIEIRDQLEQILTAQLPEDVQVTLDVWEEEALALDPVLRVPAQLCAEQLDLIMASASINFPPGETDIDAASLPIIDRVAEVLKGCPGARFEVGGHTDSQGRESSNMAISQARANAVLTALLERKVDMVFLFAKGYGEAEPVADNETEEGRARNRRIAFRLITDEEVTASDEPIVQAVTEEESAESEIATTRRESPTTIVLPAGTDPASILPQIGDDGAADDPATDADDAPAAVALATEGDTQAEVTTDSEAEVTDSDPATNPAEQSEAVASVTVEDPVDAEVANDAALLAGATAADPDNGDDAADSEAGAGEESGVDAAAEVSAAEAEPEPATTEDSDLTRPMPRSGNLN